MSRQNKDVWVSTKAGVLQEVSSDTIVLPRTAMEDSVTAGASETPTVAGDTFGRPHSVQVSQSLQLWILIPGLLIFLLVGELESFSLRS